jgi:hypothetical protein
LLSGNQRDGVQYVDGERRVQFSCGSKTNGVVVDGHKRSEEWNDQLRTTISLTPGRHRIVVQAVDQDDSFSPRAIEVTVP